MRKKDVCSLKKGRNTKWLYMKRYWGDTDWGKYNEKWVKVVTGSGTYKEDHWKNPRMYGF